MAMAGDIPPPVMFRHPHYPGVLSPQPPPPLAMIARRAHHPLLSLQSLQAWKIGKKALFFSC